MSPICSYLIIYINFHYDVISKNTRWKNENNRMSITAKSKKYRVIFEVLSPEKSQKV